MLFRMCDAFVTWLNLDAGDRGGDVILDWADDR
jgi:hypothetical protein